MPVTWNLKKWLALERDIYRPSELQSILAEKAGVHLSLQAVSALMNGTPSGIRFQTIQALCDALDCSLCDFCNVEPNISSERQKKLKVAGDTPKRLYGGKNSQKKTESLFPDPYEFIENSNKNRVKRRQRD